MPQTQILGTSPLGPAVLAVDPTMMAARVAMRPLDYQGAGTVLGHYGVSQASGAAVSISAATDIASIRWGDLSRFLVLMRLRFGWSITGGITVATRMAAMFYMARGFSTDATANNTQANMASAANTNKMRQTMGTSLMGTAGPNICTTAAMTGAVRTLDANPFTYHTAPSLVMTNAVGAVVTQQVGAASPLLQDVYDWRNLGQHPIVLSVNEGIVVQLVTAGPVTGSVKYYAEWTWAEVAVF